MEIKRLVRENILKMKSYSSARDEFSGVDGLFLDANENPYQNGVNRYPDPYQQELKIVIAEQRSVELEQVLLGNGSDEVLDLLFRAFCEPKQDNVVLASPSYGMYKVLANLNDVRCNEVLLESDFSLDADKIIAATDENTKLIILCSPNNPTGNSISKEVVEKVLNNTNCLVVVDEAYIDFSLSNSLINYLNKYDQLDNLYDNRVELPVDLRWDQKIQRMYYPGDIYGSEYLLKHDPLMKKVFQQKK